MAILCDGFFFGQAQAAGLAGDGLFIVQRLLGFAQLAAAQAADDVQGQDDKQGGQGYPKYHGRYAKLGVKSGRRRGQLENATL